MLNKPFIIAVCLNFVLLVVAGYYYTDAKAQNELSSNITQEKEALKAASEKLESENSSLKNRLALLDGNGSNDNSTELQRYLKSLEEKDEEISRLKKLIAQNNANPPQQEGRRERNNPRPRGNPDEWMAKLKESDPERYERIMQQREQRKQMLKERTEKRDNYLSRLDMSKLNSEQRQTITDYQALIKENEELRASMSEAGGMANFRDIMRNQGELSRLSGSVRDILIEQFAGENVAEEVKNIIDATTPEGRGGPGGFGPGGFGPGRFGRGGPGGQR